MDDSSKKELIEQFRNVTGSSVERARFFLESAGWNSGLAIEHFYDNNQEEMNMVSDEEVEEETEFPVEMPQPEESDRNLPKPGPTSSDRNSGIKPVTSSRIATIGTIHNNDTSSDEEEGQAFYAGGSESGGGQQIIGPKKRNHESLVAEMFKTAKEHGAEVLESPRDKDPRKKRPVYFQGVAYRLGGENESAGRSASEAAQPSTSRPPNVDVVLRFWRNGFSINDGPLRDFHDPNNMEFLNDIRTGKIPRELVQLARGSAVTLDMEDHSHEDYARPRAALQAFSGQGHRLGNPTDGCLSSEPIATAGTSVDSGRPNDVSGAGAESPSKIQVNEGLPTTSIQIRLPDGSRLIGKFNHSHTVSDIRHFVVESRPAYSNTNFVLMTTFPNKEITDECRSLEEASLINSVVVVHVKRS